jgi:hypothetical protein
MADGDEPVIDGDHPRPDRRTLDTTGSWSTTEPSEPTDDSPDRGEDTGHDDSPDRGEDTGHDDSPDRGERAQEPGEAAPVDRYADSPGAALVEGTDPVEPNEPA